MSESHMAHCPCASGTRRPEKHTRHVCRCAQHPESKVEEKVNKVLSHGKSIWPLSTQSGKALGPASRNVLSPYPLVLAGDGRGGQGPGLAQ